MREKKRKSYQNRLEPTTHLSENSIAKPEKKIGNFSLIERVILSAGAMLIFSVYFQYTICPEGRNIYTEYSAVKKKIGCFSLIERVILSAGAMLIFSVYFHLTICPEGRKGYPNSSF
ncbi:hypothetical protein ACN42_g966 [Penicillium freii]|uniref:Uncharacterized protein n=1 Tax=Penicillium freii TaxID=48697 RepID=A0A124GT09_PENFR|nr:hypothetical protein ACN42_g966 [Penicillium freii]